MTLRSVRRMAPNQCREGSEIRSANLTRPHETHVWREGMGTWAKQ